MKRTPGGFRSDRSKTRQRNDYQSANNYQSTLIKKYQSGCLVIKRQIGSDYFNAINNPASNVNNNRSRSIKIHILHKFHPFTCVTVLIRLIQFDCRHYLPEKVGEDHQQTLVAFYSCFFELQKKTLQKTDRPSDCPFTIRISKVSIKNSLIFVVD